MGLQCHRQRLYSSWQATSGRVVRHAASLHEVSRLELIGDSAARRGLRRGATTVEGDRIVEADAPGLARPLVGLTLLEAAAVPGETLAADALANAIAPAFAAAPAPGGSPSR